MIQPHPLTFSQQELVAALEAICRPLVEPAQARTAAAVVRSEPLPVAAPSPQEGLVGCLMAIASAQARHPQGLRELGSR